MERPHFLQPVFAIKGYRGTTLFENECLRIFAISTSNSMFPFFLVSGFIDGQGEAFVGLSPFGILLVNIRHGELSNNASRATVSSYREFSTQISSPKFISFAGPAGGKKYHCPQ